MPGKTSSAMLEGGAQPVTVPRSRFRSLSTRFRGGIDLVTAEHPPCTDTSTLKKERPLRSLYTPLKLADKMRFAKPMSKLKRCTHRLGGMINKERRQDGLEKLEERRADSTPLRKGYFVKIAQRKRPKFTPHEMSGTNGGEQDWNEDTESVEESMLAWDTRRNGVYVGRYTPTPDDFIFEVARDDSAPGGSPDDFAERRYGVSLRFRGDMIPLLSRTPDEDDGEAANSADSDLPVADVPLLEVSAWLPTADEYVLLFNSASQAYLPRYEHLWNDPFAGPIDQGLFENFDSSLGEPVPLGSGLKLGEGDDDNDLHDFNEPITFDEETMGEWRSLIRNCRAQGSSQRPYRGTTGTPLCR